MMFVQTLIAAKAQLDEANCAGLTALSVAENKGHNEVPKQLKMPKKNFKDIPYYFLHSSYLEVFLNLTFK